MVLWRGGSRINDSSRNRYNFWRYWWIFTRQIWRRKGSRKVAGGSKGAAKYADKSENAAIKVAKDSTPQFEKLQQQLAGIQGKEERSELISSFKQEMSDTTKALTALAEKTRRPIKETPEEVQDYLTKIDHLELMAAD